MGVDAISEQLRQIGAYVFREQRFALSSTSQAKVVEIVARGASPKRTRSKRVAMPRMSPSVEQTYAVTSGKIGSGLARPSMASPVDESFDTFTTFPQARSSAGALLLPPSQMGNMAGGASRSSLSRGASISAASWAESSVIFASTHRHGDEGFDSTSVRSYSTIGSLPSPGLELGGGFGGMRLSAKGTKVANGTGQHALPMAGHQAPRLSLTRVPHTLRRSKHTLTDLRLASQLDQPDWVSNAPRSTSTGRQETLPRASMPPADMKLEVDPLPILSVPTLSLRSRSRPLASPSVPNFDSYSSRASSRASPRAYSSSIRSSSSAGSCNATMSRSNSSANLFSSVGSSGMLSTSWTDVDSLSIRSGGSGSSSINLNGSPSRELSLSRGLAKKGSMSFLGGHEEVRSRR